MRKIAKRTMLRIYLVNFVLVLVLAGNASAIDWSGGGGGNHLWSLPANWVGGSVPTSADTAVINNPPDANCLINSTVTAVCSALTVGLNTGPCYLNMTGGTLASTGNLIVGSTTAVVGTPDTNGVFILSGGTARTTGPDARLWIGYGVTTTPANSAVGTFIMTGGVMDINGTKIELGKNPSGVGRMYISGGTLKLTRPGSSADFEIAKYGNATIVMTGGDVNILDTVKFGADSAVEWTGTAHMDLHGGTFYCNNFYMGSKSTIDITEGRMRVATDSSQSRIQGYRNNGWIKAYSGGGIVDVMLTGGAVWVTGRLGDPNLAWGPQPGDHATVQWTPAGPALSWNAGRYAASHDVYFGTSSPPVFKVNQASRTYNPGPLDLGKTYYWRINEVNNTPPGSPWQGPVWQFTMANYLVVDDMEDYNSTDAIYDTWLDGVASSARGGSVIGYRDNPPYVEQTIIYGGKQSMPYYYDNSGFNMYGQENLPYFSEAEAATTGPDSLNVTQNWTTGGIKALVLYFYGKVDNAAGATERMYVALKDNANKMAVVYYNGDANDVKEPEWHEWNIRLKDFNDINDVNLSSISKVYIGFGNRYNHPDPGGWGLVFFDEIRLYVTRCVPSLGPAGDVDDDCNVDYVDVNMMAGDWLEKDYNGVGSDGVLHNFDGSQWVTDPTHGRCLAFDGVNDWVDLEDNQFSNFHNKTIALWVKIRAFPSSYPYIFYFSNGAATNPYRIYIQTHSDGAVRARFLEDYTTDFITGTDVWRHLAFVLRDTADGLCTGVFYGDGFLVDSMSGRPRHSGGAVGVNLGSSNDGSSGFVNAVYDDFRVYDRALSGGEIGVLAGGGEGPTDKMLLRYTFEGDSGLTARNSSTYVFNRPLLSTSELYAGEPQGSRVVNFRDFAILADSWLEEQMFPRP